jgi:hypothetical protein
MKPTKKTIHLSQTDAKDIGDLLTKLKTVIIDARQQSLRAVDVVHVKTCWTIGQHIVEFEQGGATRATYGTRLLVVLAEKLTSEFGKGFDASNLRYMRLFYNVFPNCDALRHELSWTHYRIGSSINRKPSNLSVRTGKRICICGPATAHQHGVKRFLHRPRFL